MPFIVRVAKLETRPAMNLSGTKEGLWPRPKLKAHTATFLCSAPLCSSPIGRFCAPTPNRTWRRRTTGHDRSLESKGWYAFPGERNGSPHDRRVARLGIGTNSLSQQQWRAPKRAAGERQFVARTEPTFAAPVAATQDLPNRRPRRLPGVVANSQSCDLRSYANGSSPAAECIAAGVPPRDQAASCICTRAGARGGARACSPKCARICSITGVSRMAG